jgi:hypothetical protein
LSVTEEEGADAKGKSGVSWSCIALFFVPIERPEKSSQKTSKKQKKRERNIMETAKKKE